MIKEKEGKLKELENNIELKKAEQSKE